MKYFWFLVFLLMFSCGKKTAVVVPEPIPQKYTIETIVVSGKGKISSSASEVVPGASITITLQPDFGYLLPSNFIVNGNTMSLTTSSISLVVNGNLKLQVSFVASKLINILVSKSWIADSVYIGTNRYASTSGEVFVPKINGRFETYLKGILVGEGSWSLDESLSPPELIKEGQKFPIVTLTSEKLKLSVDGSLMVYK